MRTEGQERSLGSHRDSGRRAEKEQDKLTEAGKVCGSFRTWQAAPSLRRQENRMGSIEGEE